ncbi:hypothetical protein [Prochlorococcus marinus]|uniref:hypothetical protein n=1 Tax=Prochlorococcus TaxID=1218 RepID=UPI001F20BBE1|nr:hypothetical protein [Prochlorococcus marinus]
MLRSISDRSRRRPLVVFCRRVALLSALSINVCVERSANEDAPISRMPVPAATTASDIPNPLLGKG